MNFNVYFSHFLSPLFLFAPKAKKHYMQQWPGEEGVQRNNETSNYEMNVPTYFAINDSFIDSFID